ncbi:MAG: endo-1,4-beta-xylanase [Clostridiales bacterium]|nr:endo-1,4-beta-xylanase [Clostridiales bacterium]
MTRQESALRYFREQKGSVRSRIENGIEQNRKRDAVIRIVSDRPLPDDITVRAEQKNHEFRFGANLFMLDEFETEEKNALYRQKFPEIFNLATVPFYWSDLEPVEGQPRFAKDSPRVYRRPAPDLCVEYCREKGIEPKCHCLNYDSFLPPWLANASVEEHKRKLDKRFREIAERYADAIPSFEVTNETLQRGKSAFFYEPDFVEWSFREADRYFPANRLIINDYNIWWPESYNNRHAYYMQIERLMQRGIRHIDSVGMQFHSFFPLSSEPSMAATRYNPEILLRLMDTYAPLGLAEQITEMTIPAYSASDEDEEIQADLIEGVYTAFFSHPAMEAVIYWNLVDGYAYNAVPGDMKAGENVYHGGLLRFDMSEKPACRRLKKLIRKDWHTDVTVKAQNGTAAFRGFCGDYEIRVYADGREIPASFALSKKGRNEITVRI